MEDLQWAFINSELLSLSINAAFQRAHIYSQTASDSDRLKIRAKIRILLCALGKRYEVTQTSDQHIQNIKALSDQMTEEFKQSGTLRESRFRIGIAQKAVNLYLKYLWCLGKIPPPPHCPFDGVVIRKLSLRDAQYRALQWTKLDSIAGYKALVDAAIIAVRAKEFPSLAEWELHEYPFETEGVLASLRS